MPTVPYSQTILICTLPFSVAPESAPSSCSKPWHIFSSLLRTGFIEAIYLTLCCCSSPPSLLFSLRDLCRLSRPPRQPTLGTREALPSRFSVPMGHENRPLKRVSIMAGGTHPCSTSFTPIGAFRSEHLSERTPHDRRVTAAYPLLSVQRVYSAKTLSKIAK